MVLLRGYKVLISPHFRGSCRFLPSCADYAAIAVARHGAVRGSWLGAKRLARCHPLCAAGYDPVPRANPRVVSLSPFDAAQGDPEALERSNHERRARPSAFVEATADRRSAKRGGWSTSSGRA